MHDIRKSQDLAAQEEEFAIKKAFRDIKKYLQYRNPTPKDYTDYLRGLIKELEESMKHVLSRLHALEEKERQRSMDKHQIELSLDEISEPVPYVPPKDGVKE